MRSRPEPIEWTSITVPCPAKPFLDKREVAEIAGVKTKQIDEWVEQNRFPQPNRLNGMWSSRAIAAWLLVMEMFWRDPKVSYLEEDDHEPEAKTVYFISRGDVVKIGIAVDPQQRMASLQTAIPEPLKILHTESGGLDRERVLHAMFAEFRLRPNGEWFKLTEEIQTYIGGQG